MTMSLQECLDDYLLQRINKNKEEEKSHNAEGDLTGEDRRVRSKMSHRPLVR